MLKQLKLQPFAILVDACIVINAFTLAALVLFSKQTYFDYDRDLLFFLPFAVFFYVFINLQFGLYRSIGRYIGLRQAIRICQSSLVCGVALIFLGWLMMPSSFLYVLSLVPVGAIITFILMAGIRFYPRFFYERSLKEVKNKLRLLIVGAGSAGEMIVRNVQKEPQSDIDAVALVDDDPSLKDMEIHGLPILGPTSDILGIVSKKDIDEILIAIPSATLEEFQRILSICNQTGKPVKTLRPLQSAQYGKVGLRHIREIQIEDVLGRQPVHTDYAGIRERFAGKTVLVTGAGGSIGSELALQISQHGPALVILLDHDESSLYKIHKKLAQLCLQCHDMVIADIKNEKKMESLFEEYRPDLVFHAAAYKHVPLMEIHADEAVLNNVMGTEIVARLSGVYGAAGFVNISTDKAVEPVNVMGSTKYLGERLVRDLQHLYPDTRYCSVRFGNVLGSRGSVIPIFNEQIMDGGPITVTHPEMTRYFMLISEAVDLILQTTLFPDKNAIYVLDMGDPVKIVDLANQMIEIMNAPETIEMTFIGLRPGEKLHERLFEGNEKRETTAHPKIHRVVHPEAVKPAALLEMEELFESAKNTDCKQVKSLLNAMIPSYKPFDMTTVGNIGSETDDGLHSEESGDSYFKIPENINYKWTKASRFETDR